MTTPHIAVAQGIFDIVVEKAASMPRQSREPKGTMCLYRGPDGNRCFAGWLLPDESVVRGDGSPFYGDVTQLKASGKLPDYLQPHTRLIKDLQIVHDTVSNWLSDGPASPKMPRELRDVAKRHGLKTEVVDTFFPA